MEIEKTKQFYSELGLLFEKYGIEGFNGLLFERDDIILGVLYDPTDHETKALVEFAMPVLRVLIMELSGSAKLKDISKGMTGPADNSENN